MPTSGPNTRKPRVPLSKSRRKQIENGYVSSVHQAAAACNVSRSAVERWLSVGCSLSRRFLYLSDTASDARLGVGQIGHVLLGWGLHCKHITPPLGNQGGTGLLHMCLNSLHMWLK
jgi:hypothetical protein